MDGARDLGPEATTYGVEAALDRLEVGLGWGHEAHEHGAAAGLWRDVEDPQALEVGIVELAREDEVDTLVDLAAQLGELALGWAGKGVEGMGGRGRTTAAATTFGLGQLDSHSKGAGRRSTRG